MKENFVTHEQALALKELGFDELCIFIYDTEGVLYSDVTSEKQLLEGGIFYNTMFYRGCSAPLKQQVFKWFIDKHNMFGKIHLAPSLIEGVSNYSFSIDTINELESSSHPSHFSYSYYSYYHEHTNHKWHNSRFKTYEKAESACLDKLIKIVNI